MAVRDSQGNFITQSTVGDTAYEYDWFSGSQIGVMIGDVLIDGAVAISFSVEQSKTPIYGYANQYYSFVADGHVLVQGTLTVAFKEAGYLMWPMQRHQSFAAANDSINRGFSEDDAKWNSPRYSTNAKGVKVNSYDPSKSNYSLTGASKAAKNKRVMEANVEQMMEWQAKGDLNRQNYKYNKFFKDLGAMSDPEFENWAETFEDAIWYGSDSANPLVREKLFSNNVNPVNDISDEQVLQHRRVDQYPQMDVWIVYGDMSRQPSNHTVKKILDLSFVGQSQTIEISGQPIYEQYSFIARNLV